MSALPNNSTLAMGHPINFCTEGLRMSPDITLAANPRFC